MQCSIVGCWGVKDCARTRGIKTLFFGIAFFRETRETRNKKSEKQEYFNQKSLLKKGRSGLEVRLGTHNLFRKVSKYVLKGTLVRSNIYSEQAGYTGYTSNKPFCQLDVDYWRFSSN